MTTRVLPAKSTQGAFFHLPEMHTSMVLSATAAPSIVKNASSERLSQTGAVRIVRLRCCLDRLPPAKLVKDRVHDPCGENDFSVRDGHRSVFDNRAVKRF